MERQLRHVDVFVAMSEFSRDKHRELGFPREMEVLPYFVPDDVSPDAAAGPPHPRPYFLFVGRLEAMKGLDDVVDVFATYDQADLLIVGDGPQAAELRRRAAGNPRIRFLGHLATERIAPYYRHATALIVPSHCFETFGITIIEAFEQGTPVIGRRIGPFPEIVERFGGGELFDTRDQLEAAMRRLVGCAGRREQMSRAATEAFRAHWCEATVLPRYLAIVDKADERRRSRQA